MKTYDMSRNNELHQFSEKFFLQALPVRAKEKPFTKREIDCIRFLVEGYTAKTTARKLNISHRTVERHLDNIREKLGVKRKIEIVGKAMYFQWLVEHSSAA